MLSSEITHFALINLRIMEIMRKFLVLFTQTTEYLKQYRSYSLLSRSKIHK